MKTVEIRKLSVEELTKESVKLRDEIMTLKSQIKLGQLTNVRQVKMKRKDLARVLTVLSDELAKETE